MLIIVCDPNEERGKIFTSSLIKHFECDVYHVSDADSAINYIDLLPHLDLIICPASNNNFILAEKISNEASRKSKSLKVLSFGQPVLKAKNLYTLNREPAVGELLKVVEAMLSQARMTQSEYRSLPLNFIKFLEPAPADLYFKLSKEKQKTVKFLKKGDSLDDDSYQKYRAKGVLFFYVKLKDFASVLEAVMNNFNLRYPIGSEDMDLSETILGLLNFVGFSEEKAKVFLDKIDNDLEEVRQNKALASFLPTLLEGQNTYMQKHSLLTSVLVYILLSDQDWAYKEHYKKASLAAFAMDFKLGSENLIQLRDNDEVNALSITRGQKAYDF